MRIGVFRLVFAFRRGCDRQQTMRCLVDRSDHQQQATGDVVSGFIRIRCLVVRRLPHRGGIL